MFGVVACMYQKERRPAKRYVVLYHKQKQFKFHGAFPTQLGQLRAHHIAIIFHYDPSLPHKWCHHHGNHILLWGDSSELNRCVWLCSYFVPCTHQLLVSSPKHVPCTHNDVKRISIDRVCDSDVIFPDSLA